MSRRLLTLLAASSLGLMLTGCDNPAAGILSTAKTGDCFTVTGKDAMGQPKLIHSDCPAGAAPGSTLPPADQQAQADPAPAGEAGPPSAVMPEASVGSRPVASATGKVCRQVTTCVAAAKPAPAPKAAPKLVAAPVCRPVAPACVTSGAPVIRYGVAAAGHRHSAVVHTAHLAAARPAHMRRVRHKVTHQRHGHVVTEYVTEYVPESGVVPIGPTELAGGYADSRAYERHEEHAYAPPSPPAPQYDRRDVERREAERREFERRETERREVERRELEQRQYQARSSESRSYESRSYISSSSAGQAVVQARKPCNCAPPRPHYEPDGYLTWPGKPAVY